MTKRSTFLANALGLVAFFIAWELASFWLGDYWVPGIGQVSERFGTELLAGRLLVDLAATTQLLLAGTAIGIVVGCGMACAVRLYPRVDSMLQPFITAVMSIPKLGLVPLLVLWFGTGWAPKVMLVALTVLFIVFALTYSGLLTLDSRLIMTARVFGANSFQITRDIVIPSVLPYIYTGLQVALPWAVSAALVAEYLSARVGVGHGIEEARQLSDSVGVYYGIILATAIVLACNGALTIARRLTIKVQV